MSAKRDMSIRLMRTANYALSIFSFVLGFIQAKILDLRMALICKSFVPRNDDIFIVTYPRSGTTWLQQILYQLTTDGNMEFEHISQQVPFLEHALGKGRSLNRPSPRIFKTHLNYRMVPKGDCRYIYVARNGKDVAVSYYYYHKSHMGFGKSFNEFFNQYISGKVGYGSWFAHVKDWWQRRNDPNVLFLTYEEMTEDLEAVIKKICAFCNIELNLEALPGILERCSFAFMKQHENKFDTLMEFAWERHQQENAFFRKGQTADWKGHLDSQQEEAFEKEFATRMGDLGVDGATLGGPVRVTPSQVEKAVTPNNTTTSAALIQ
ncbi:MAG TPA: sulfotransferase domain-containing protein [Pyrinomonadaceae bacterium]|nr:sulfotransferase domain-containing protein [Pyrinomonadaceae bacterium]